MSNMDVLGHSLNNNDAAVLSAKLDCDDNVPVLNIASRSQKEKQQDHCLRCAIEKRKMEVKCCKDI